MKKFSSITLIGSIIVPLMAHAMERKAIAPRTSSVARFVDKIRSGYNDYLVEKEAERMVDALLPNEENHESKKNHSGITTAYKILAQGINDAAEEQAARNIVKSMAPLAIDEKPTNEGNQTKKFKAAL